MGLAKRGQHATDHTGGPLQNFIAAKQLAGLIGRKINRQTAEMIALGQDSANGDA